MLNVKHSITGLKTGPDNQRRGANYTSWIIIATLALTSLGVVMIYSAGSRVDRRPQWFASLSDPAGKQMVFAAVAFVALLAAGAVDYRKLCYDGPIWRWGGLYLLIVSLVLLGAVYIPGVGLEVNRARRWVQVGAVSFQPSEIAKFAIVIFLAGLLARPSYPRKSFFAGVLPLALAAGAVCGLIGIEDLGTGALIALVVALLMIAAGVRTLHMLVLALPAVAGFAYLLILSPYRLSRLIGFTDMWSDPQGLGYHPIQSLVAIGSGGWWGVGLGNGIQKYGYLPEDTTDFIFSIICEELGMCGAVLVISLMMVLVLAGWQVFRRCDDDLGRLITFGIIATIGLQAAMNIAVATVSVPTKGIALPFVSAGGSGLLLSATALGLVCSVARYGHSQEARP